MQGKRKKVTGFDLFNIITLGFFMLLVLGPYYYMIVESLMSASDFAFSGGGILFPSRPVLSNYTSLFATGRIGEGYFNSMLYTVAGVLYSMVLTVTLSYGLSKKKFPGRKLLQNMVVFTMFFNGGLVPFFLIVKNLGLMNSRAAVIIPLGLNLFNMIILRSFFEHLPPDLEESAVIDGAGPLTVFVRIHLPLIKPALATIVLFYAVDRWNEWFFSSLFLGDSKLWPIQLTLRQVLWATGSFAQNIPPEAGRKVFSEGLKAASVIVTMLPVMCVYPFLQKYFVKGVMIGAIKS